MDRPISTSSNAWPGVPRTLRALMKLLWTSILAAIAGGLFAALLADALGLSVFIAGGVSGTLAAIVVALVIARHGPNPSSSGREEA